MPRRAPSMPGSTWRASAGRRGGGNRPADRPADRRGARAPQPARRPRAVRDPRHPRPRPRPAERPRRRRVMAIVQRPLAAVGRWDTDRLELATARPGAEAFRADDDGVPPTRSSSSASPATRSSSAARRARDRRRDPPRLSAVGGRDRDHAPATRRGRTFAPGS